jgi:hypothetical protein
MSNTDNENYNMFIEHNNKNIKKITRTPKKIKFKAERELILNKMKVILGVDNVDSDVLKFYLYDIESDQNKINEIMELKDDVGKYFTSKNNIVFKKPEEAKKNYLSLIRLVFKEFDYEAFTTPKSITRNEKYIKTLICLFIEK